MKPVVGFPRSGNFYPIVVVCHSDKEKIHVQLLGSL